MNERIRELAEQAENYAHEQNDKFGLSYKREYDKKFAELIVQDYSNKTIQALMCDPAFVQAMDEYYERKWAHRFG